MSTLTMSWADRFAVIDHYKPTDAQILSAFNLKQDDLDVARELRKAGTFAANATLDVAKYANIFSADGAAPTATSTPTVAVPGASKPAKTGTATTHAKPESATKRVKVPQKRGRKGDKIARALASVPTAQTPVTTFMQQHGVSLAVLRQSKRFIEKLSAEQQKSIGKINVRQDKATKQLMIWRETV